MDFKKLFIELIDSFLCGHLTREDVESKMAFEVPLDVNLGDQNDLMTNCIWGLRHINEPGYWTMEKELRYYLACLKGEELYSSQKRDRILTGVE